MSFQVQIDDESRLSDTEYHVIFEDDGDECLISSQCESEAAARALRDRLNAALNEERASRITEAVQRKVPRPAG